MRYWQEKLAKIYQEVQFAVQNVAFKRLFYVRFKKFIFLPDGGIYDQKQEKETEKEEKTSSKSLGAATQRN